jgi:hypothetical protein
MSTKTRDTTGRTLAKISLFFNLLLLDLYLILVYNKVSLFNNYTLIFKPKL